jgi:hypothetical protein
MTNKRVGGFDDPQAFDDAFSAFVKKHVEAVLWDMGWRPSEEEPGVWMAPAPGQGLGQSPPEEEE